MTFYAQIAAPVTIADSQGNPVTAVAGALKTTDVGQLTSTYSAIALNLVIGTAATDIFAISGSATKTVKVRRLGFSATQTSNGIMSVQLIKRSAADTGGTSTSPLAVPHDSIDSAATAAIKAYTVNPTALGASVGPVRASKIGAPAANATAVTLVEWDLDTDSQKSITLRGTGESLALNLNGVTPSGANFDVYVVWTEE